MTDRNVPHVAHFERFAELRAIYPRADFDELMAFIYEEDDEAEQAAYCAAILRAEASYRAYAVLGSYQMAIGDYQTKDEAMDALREAGAYHSGHVERLEEQS